MQVWYVLYLKVHPSFFWSLCTALYVFHCNCINKYSGVILTLNCNCPIIQKAGWNLCHKNYNMFGNKANFHTLIYISKLTGRTAHSTGDKKMFSNNWKHFKVVQKWPKFDATFEKTYAFCISLTCCIRNVHRLWMQV